MPQLQIKHQDILPRTPPPPHPPPPNRYPSSSTSRSPCILILIIIIILTLTIFSLRILASLLWRCTFKFPYLRRLTPAAQNVQKAQGYGPRKNPFGALAKLVPRHCHTSMCFWRKPVSQYACRERLAMNGHVHHAAAGFITRTVAVINIIFGSR